MSRENREGLRRLLWEADLTFTQFGVFMKLPDMIKTKYGYRVPKWYKWFLRWQKFNHGCWHLYFRIRKAKFNRIGYL